MIEIKIGRIFVIVIAIMIWMVKRIEKIARRRLRGIKIRLRLIKMGITNIIIIVKEEKITLTPNTMIMMKMTI